MSRLEEPMLTIETTHALQELERDAIVALLHDFWRARLMDAATAIRQYAAPDIAFGVLSGGQGPSAWHIFEGLDAVTEAVRGIDVNLEFLNFEVVDLIIDGGRAALRWHARLRNRGTGVIGDLAVFDLVSVADGLITDYVEFFDTDGFARLMSGEAQPGMARRANAEAVLPRFTDFAPAESPRSDRENTAARIRAFYADRMRFGSAAVEMHFAEDGELRIIGDPVTIPFARRHSGRDQVAALIGQVDMEFAIEDFEIVDLLLDGSRAAVRWVAAARHRGTGTAIRVEAFNHVVLRDGRIASITEFFDTAATARSIAG
jgi:ketosteroid isomerase-like protein